MEKKIYANKQDRAKLAEIFNTSISTISVALNFRRNNLRHAQIRSCCMNDLDGIYILYEL